MWIVPKVSTSKPNSIYCAPWHLINNGPGQVELGKAARRLPPSDCERLREALLAAGADTHALQAFDLQAGNAT